MQPFKALWQYVRIPINRIIGVDQAAVDTSFRTKPTDDMVPGIIGAVAAGGDSSGHVCVGVWVLSPMWLHGIFRGEV